MTQATESREAIPKGYWEDAKGNLVRVDRIKDLDKRRDEVVRALCAQAEEHSGQISEFKLAAMAEVAGFIEESAAEYEVTLRGAAGKGNVTLTSYDGRYKVQRSMADVIVFDERLQTAKALVDECILAWSKGANKHLQVLVAEAFQTDQEGNVSAGKVLALRRHKIDDPQWHKAMDVIADSVKVSGSKPYIRFFKRDDLSGEYLPITLNVAKA